MKICAMCGRKILKSMIPFQIMLPGANMKTIDSCGQCFLLTRINDVLHKSMTDTELKGGSPLGGH